jgi:hypothetical protein
MLQCALRPGEIDQAVDIFQASGEVIGNDDIACHTHQFAGTALPITGLPGRSNAAPSVTCASLSARLDQHAAHTAASTHNTNSRSSHCLKSKHIHEDDGNSPAPHVAARACRLASTGQRAKIDQASPCDGAVSSADISHATSPSTRSRSGLPHQRKRQACATPPCPSYRCDRDKHSPSAAGGKYQQSTACRAIKRT